MCWSLCSVYGNGNEFDGPHRIPLSYKEVDDYDVILDRVGERVRSNIGAVRAYVRTPSLTHLPTYLLRVKLAGTCGTKKSRPAFLGPK